MLQKNMDDLNCMKDYIDRPVYPMLDIGLDSWRGLFSVCVLNDCFYGSRNKFNRHMLHNMFLDCNGTVWQAIDAIPISWWRPYVPFVAAFNILYRKTDDCWSLHKTKMYVVTKIEAAFKDVNVEVEDLKDEILKVDSLKELYEILIYDDR